jgi:hypothetical protein
MALNERYSTNAGRVRHISTVRNRWRGR